MAGDSENRLRESRGVRVNFLELHNGEVRRKHRRRTPGSVKLRSWVTVLGQQGTEAERRRSVNFGDS